MPFTVFETVPAKGDHVLKRVPIIAVIVAALLLPSAINAKTNRNRTKRSAQVPAATAGTFEAKIEGLMRQSGYDFRKVKQNSWYLILPGREMAQIRIILGAGPSQIAMGAVVLTKGDVPMNAQAFHELLKLSYSLNYVHVCIDADDDLIVMSQKKDPWLNVEEFKTTVSQVSAAADRAFAVMKPYLSR